MSTTRIRKLLALATDQEGTPEGEAAARVARRMIRERGVEMDGLDASQRDQRDPFVRLALLLGGPEHWRCRLLTLVAEHCECVAGYRRGKGKASLYGRRSSVELAEYLYTVLGRAITRERVGWSLGMGGEVADAERGRRTNDFTRSALLALSMRLEQLRRLEEQGGGAMVRAHNTGLGGWMRAQGVQLQKEPPFPYAYSEEGYRAGFRLPLMGAVEEGA